MGRVETAREGEGKRKQEARPCTRAHACVCIDYFGGQTCARRLMRAHHGDASSDVGQSQSAALRALLVACCAHTTAATGTHVRIRLCWEADAMVTRVGWECGRVHGWVASVRTDRGR